MSDQMDQMKNAIVCKLGSSGLPEYRESSFIASKNRRCSGRSRLVEGSLKTSEGGTVRIILKCLNEAYAVGNTLGRDAPSYKVKLLAYFEREVDIWRRAGNHPNVASICGFMTNFKKDIFPALLFRFYPLGDLRVYIEDREPFTPIKLRLQLLHDVACGLRHLHNLHPCIVHRDLSASNVLVNSPSSQSTRITACINDFGSAKLFDPELNVVNKSTNKSSFAWEPPEYVHSDTYLESYSNPQPSGDVWSFGCTFLEVLTACDPWPKGIDYRNELEHRRHPPIPKDFDKPGYAKFLEHCWKKSPKDRITSTEIVTHLDTFVQRKE